MADIFGEWEHREDEIGEKLSDDSLLPPVLSALEQFHEGLRREMSRRRGIDERGGPRVAALHPDQDVRIKDHGAGHPAGDP
jgi:hypothetical protein